MSAGSKTISVYDDKPAGVFVIDFSTATVSSVFIIAKPIGVSSGAEDGVRW